MPVSHLTHLGPVVSLIGSEYAQLDSLFPLFTSPPSVLDDSAKVVGNITGRKRFWRLFWR